MNANAKVDSLFRQVTPLFLLGLLGMVLLEPLAPAWLTEALGDDVVLKVVVAFLVLYVLLLWGESLRLHGLLTGLLEAFKNFDREQAGGAPRGKGANNPRARREAARLLIAALSSDDAEVRETSRHNLVRLVGQDLGDDPAAWQAWLAEQPGG
ncbi:MAG: hypothetical protein ACON4Z_12000 [Planctomycetota bacterium]